MTEKRPPREGRIFRIIGGAGFSAMFLVNLYDWFGKAQPSSEFFSDGWWASWFSGYIFWLIILGVGMAGRRRVTGNLLFVEEVTGARTASQPDPVSSQLIFDRVFKIYLEKAGTETDAEILKAVRSVMRSDDEALMFFERCKDLDNDARHFMRLKSIGKIELPAVRKELLNEHPDLSWESLEKAMAFGAAQVEKTA